jgi:UDP-glucuronate decarboxylase
VALKDGLQATIAYFALQIAGETPALVPSIARRGTDRTARNQMKVVDPSL